MRPAAPRSGFAMMLVLVFIVLFLAMLGVTLRETAIEIPNTFTVGANETPTRFWRS